MSLQLSARKLPRTLLAAICFLLVLAILPVATSSPNNAIAAPQNQCATVTSADLVKAIYNQIKVKYDGQKSHINVSVKNNVVTLAGWVTTKDARKEIEKYAKKTKCVKKVVNTLMVGIGAGCTREQKKCGDICIPVDQDCNIGLPDSAPAN